MRKQIPMNGEELVKKIVSGEKDFQNIKLIEPRVLVKLEGYGEISCESSGFAFVSKYRKNLDFSNSDLQGIRAPGILLLESEFHNTNLRHSTFDDSLLIRTGFIHSDLRHISLEGANLTQARIIYSDLYGANLKNTEFFGATFIGPNLTNLIDFGHSNDLRYSIFRSAVADSESARVIDGAVSQREYYTLKSKGGNV